MNAHAQIGATSETLSLSVDAYNNYLTSFELSENSTRATQPSEIKTKLKLHQLAGIQRMLDLELSQPKSLCITVDHEKNRYEEEVVQRNLIVKVKTSQGVLADKPGYGKTLTCLG